MAADIQNVLMQLVVVGIFYSLLIMLDFLDALILY